MDIPLTKKLLQETQTVRTLLQKTRKMWTERNYGNHPFHTAVMLSTSPPMDAEMFCFEWVKNTREKRIQKHQRQKSKN